MPLKFTRPSRPSINWAHPANKNVQFSFVASPGLAAFDLVKKQFGTKLGAPVRVTDKIFGSALQFGSLNTDGFSFSGRGTKTLPATIAFIGILNGTGGGSRTYFQSGGAANQGLILDNQSSGTIQLVTYGIAVLNPALSVSTATPYLAIFSMWPNGTVHALLLNMATGAITTGTSTNGASINATNGTYLLGNLAGAGQGCNADLAAVLYANNVFTLDGMKAWAKDPWGPWRGVEPFDARLLMMSNSFNYINGTRPIDPFAKTQTLLNVPFGANDHWSTTFNTGSFALSNNNLTATATLHNAIDTIIGVVGHSSGKYYFEQTAAAFPVDCSNGISKASQSGGAVGQVTGVQLQYGNGTGTWNSDGSPSAVSGLAVAAGMVLGFVIDFGAGRSYVRDCASPNSWFGNGAGADPVAGTGGYNWSVNNTGIQYQSFSSSQNGIDRATTMNAGSGALVAPPPPGVRVWNAISGGGSSDETAVTVIS